MKVILFGTFEENKQAHMVAVKSYLEGSLGSKTSGALEARIMTLECMCSKRHRKSLQGFEQGIHKV